MCEVTCDLSNPIKSVFVATHLRCVEHHHLLSPNTGKHVRP